MKPSEIFSFNKTIFRNCLRQYWWWGMISIVLLMLLLVIPMMSYSTAYTIEDVLYNPTVLIYVFLSPLIISILIFRVLHSENAMVFHLGLPIKRMEMTNSLLLAGVVLMLMPLVIIIVLGFLIVGFNGEITHSLWLVLSVTSKNIIIMLNIYLIAVFISHVLGSTLGSFFIAIIIQFIPFMVYRIAALLIQQLVYGMSISYSFDGILLRFMPLPQIFDSEIGFFWGTMWSVWYIVLGIILYICIQVTSCKRPVEMSKEFIAFNFLRPIFKWGVTICSSLLIGTMVLSAIDEYSFSYTSTIISVIFGGLVGYVISLLLLGVRKDFYKHMKPMIIYSLVIITVFGVLKIDLFDFEDRLPIISEVESAGVSTRKWRNQSEVNYLSTDPLYIRSIIKSHAEILEERPNYGMPLYIKYHLKDGNEIVRAYNVVFNEIENLDGVLDHPISVKNEMEIYNLVTKDAQGINISGVFEDEYDLRINRDELNQLIAKMQDDEAVVNDVNRHSRMAIAQIEYSNIANDGSIIEQVVILRNYHVSAISWLRGLKKIEETVFPYSEVSELKINPDSESELIITDPSTIKFILDQSYDYYGDNSISIVAMRKNVDYALYTGFINSNVLEEIAE